MHEKAVTDPITDTLAPYDFTSEYQELSLSPHIDPIPSVGDHVLWEDWLQRHRVTKPHTASVHTAAAEVTYGPVFAREESNDMIPKAAEQAGNAKAVN